MDKNISMGKEGVLFTEMKGMVRHCDAKINGFISGLGGKDITLTDVEKMLEQSKKMKNGEFSWK